MPMTRWPITLHGSRYKTAEITKDDKGFDVVECPHCDYVQDVPRIGLVTCIECGRTFETFVPEIEP